MGEISHFLRDAGIRLKAERERLGLKQSELGEVGGVNRNSQAEYEAGKRPWTIAYLAATEAAGVDAGYVLWGERKSGNLSVGETELLSSFAAIDPEDQEGLLIVAAAMADRVRPRRLHAAAQGYRPEPPSLPPTPALARMFEGLLQSLDASAAPDALAHELATLLPTGLAQLSDLQPAADRPAPRADDRAPQRARRT